MKEIRQILKFYYKHKEDSIPMAIATVVNIEDSSYRRMGARMLILDNGKWIGGISGGCLEGDVLKHAKRVMATKKARLITYDTRNGDPYQIGIGLGCEGKIDIFLQALTNDSQIIKQLEIVASIRHSQILISPFNSNKKIHPLIGKSFFASEDNYKDEFSNGIYDVQKNNKSLVKLIKVGEITLDVLFEWIEPNIRLIIAGDNYDIYPMISIANEMDWDLELICNPLKIQKDKIQNISTFYAYNEIENIRTDAYTAIISMVHDYEKDKMITNYFLDKENGYFGILGPRKRFQKMCEEAGWNESDIEHVYNPVGLDIGSGTPEEIALSAAAEITKCFRGGSGQPLKMKTGNIHSRNMLS